MSVKTHGYSFLWTVCFVCFSGASCRHLNESQRAMIAAKVANIQNGGDRKSNQFANLQTVSQQEASQLLNVSPQSVAAAKQVQQTEELHFLERRFTELSCYCDRITFLCLNNLRSLLCSANRII